MLLINSGFVEETFCTYCHEMLLFCTIDDEFIRKGVRIEHIS